MRQTAASEHQVQLAMQKEIFMTAQDFVEINSQLLAACNMVMYAAQDRREAISEFDIATFDASVDYYLMLMGRRDDAHKLVGQIAINNTRSDKVDFVSIQFGGEDTNAVGTTLYLADTSETAKVVDRKLTQLLKKHAHKGVLDEESGRVNEKIYWTDAVWNAGKNKYLRFKDSPFGWRPKAAVP